MYEKLEYLQMEYGKISFSSQFSAIPGAVLSAVCFYFLKYPTPEPDREKVHEDH